MFGSGYLPAGATWDSSAPYNQPEPDYYKMQVEVELCDYDKETEEEIISTDIVNVSIPIYGNIYDYSKDDIYSLLYDELEEVIDKSIDWYIKDYWRA